MLQMTHNSKSGPMSDAEIVQAQHECRIGVNGAKIDRDFDQISEFQRYVRGQISTGPQKPRRPEVQELADVINREAFVRMYAEEGIQQIPWSRRHFETVELMLDAINYVTHTAPIFRDVSSISWQFPLSALMNFWMMIAQLQNEARNSTIITSFTVKVARAKSASMEKSISCARARVSVSIYLLVSGRVVRLFLARLLPRLEGKRQHLLVSAVSRRGLGEHPPEAAPGAPLR